MKFDTVDLWLQWQTSLHDKVIELGLERVREVGQRLDLSSIARRVITVAGTNGKGSTVAAYETWLRHAGHSVVSYTSPHLLRYNERIRHNCREVDDGALCSAFAAVEDARQGVALTYFEFGTLAALYLCRQWQPDYAVLEVGLGGRLDAVNIIDANLVHLTPIGIDHQAFLGDDREQIGFEKAGVLRPRIPVVLNDPEPPTSVVREIDRLACDCLRLARDYDYALLDGGLLRWRGLGHEFDLESPLAGRHQAQNLAGVVAGLLRLAAPQVPAAREMRENFRGLQVAGRFQAVAAPGAAQVFVDVGHNPDAARVLAESLSRLRVPGGRVVVLLGMLADKDCEQFVAQLASVVDEWWTLTLGTDRGLRAAALRARIEPAIRVEREFEEARQALDHALSSLHNQDIMLVTGSFVTVELILRALSVSDAN